MGPIACERCGFLLIGNERSPLKIKISDENVVEAKICANCLREIVLEFVDDMDLDTREAFVYHIRKRQE